MGCILATARKRPRIDAGVQSPPSENAVARKEMPSSTVEARPPVLPPRSPRDPMEFPPWLVAVAGDALCGLVPRRADSFEKIAKIGSGTYSNVYRARELGTGREVALKKVRFEAGEVESMRFMAREIRALRRVGAHPNVVHLEGIATSRASPDSLYLIFEYLDHDLTGLAAAADIHFSLPQVKCYMKQLLGGLEHCHGRGVLHRDIKGSNLLINNDGFLKIADFGLAALCDPDQKRPMTSRVVTLWYRAPELLLGVTNYSAGVDLWSAGCILAELLAGRPILPGRTEVEQLHRIFKLCGTPPEKFWKKSKLPHATIVKPRQQYKQSIRETYPDFPPTALSLIEKLLAVDPAERISATEALNSEFFAAEPVACEPESLPKYPPSKEMDAKLRNQKATRWRAADAKASKKQHAGRRKSRAVPAPDANAELQANLHRHIVMCHGRGTASKSEKFPPPHEDGAVGEFLGDDDWQTRPVSFISTDSSSFPFSVIQDVPMKKLRPWTPKSTPSGSGGIAAGK